MSVPAFLGGSPVVTEPWPTWPVWEHTEVESVLGVLDSGVWGGYSTAVADFETRFAEFTGAQHCITTSNGTVSLVAALIALGVHPGDEVLVPAYTFAATANAVGIVGATPVFVDIERETWNMDIRAAESAITSRTAAIVPVHFAGHPVDMDALLLLAGRRGLAVLEDAAHAPGSTWRGRPVGALGAMGSFSFQSNKNITSGEGGALVANDSALAHAAWSICNHGRDKEGDWYKHPRVGSNHRITGLQAAILGAQLDRYPEQLATRMAAGRHLRAVLAGTGLVPASWDARVERHAHHMLPLHYDPEQFSGMTRERFVAAMAAEGVPLPTGYPVPLNRQRAFGGRRGECPVADLACLDTLWISHNVLLSGPARLSLIVEAADRVRASAHDINRW